jgi:FkbM family methyltransferase
LTSASKLREVLKSLVVRHAPPRVLQYIRKEYHRRLLESQTDNDVPEFPVIRSLVGVGETVIDVGAATGTFTCYLSRLVGPHGTVHSIEPVAPTYDVLASVVRALRLTNVCLWNLAVSDRDGEGLIEVPRHRGRSRPNYYQARITSHASADVWSAHRIRLACLDSLLPFPSTRPSFIKIDVEAHELAVIEGALRMISEARPSLLIEVSGMNAAVSDAVALSEVLRRYLYAPYWFSMRRLRPWVIGVTASSSNYFYLTPEHLRKVATLLA